MSALSAPSKTSFRAASLLQQVLQCTGRRPGVGGKTVRCDVKKLGREMYIPFVDFEEVESPDRFKETALCGDCNQVSLNRDSFLRTQRGMVVFGAYDRFCESRDRSERQRVAAERALSVRGGNGLIGGPSRRKKGAGDPNRSRVPTSKGKAGKKGKKK